MILVLTTRVQSQFKVFRGAKICSLYCLCSIPSEGGLPMAQSLSFVAGKGGENWKRCCCQKKEGGGRREGPGGHRLPFSLQPRQRQEGKRQNFATFVPRNWRESQRETGERRSGLIHASSAASGAGRHRRWQKGMNGRLTGTNGREMAPPGKDHLRQCP